MWAYCDSSALVKRYVREPGRQRLLGLLRDRSCVSSALTPVELRSALRRRGQEGTFDVDRLPGLLDRLAVDRSHWTLVAVGPEVLTAAEALVATHPLRTLDAIHVASAQLFFARMPAPPLFLSADRRQTDVAGVVGLTARFIA